ncbi:MAG: hypothetical protein A3E87_04565 [Gammaproteobacteria bacterium RIFCSPHIGHO2_12_FULL_35_23]|nr:MAG: hypothetical protein A3E87_04565 [Gammaproteobacteria bacterium RIFCSPHIGHO2_12_FULL_35_23]
MENLLNLPTTRPASNYKLKPNKTAKQLFEELTTLVGRMERYRKNIFGKLLRIKAIHTDTHNAM